MILDELTLHNFGVYGGRQSVPLTPTDRKRPIVLFGGLNGGGKTTLLDALQLCLYGPTARCSNRNGLAYDEFLRRCVHRSADTREAAIEVAFRHTSNGKEQLFRLHRSWTANGSTCRERFHVLRDGELDKLATEHWAEQVEDFIPARIAQLFLFDGEKIEGYADLDGAPALIATAIQNLLGLDIVERLTSDLVLLERRKRTEAKTPGDRRPLEELRAKVEQLESDRRQLVADRASAANILDRRRADLAALDERYRREGGILFEKRAELETSGATAARQLEIARKELRELAGGAAPLLLVPDLLSAVASRDAAEGAAQRDQLMFSAIAEEHEALLSLPLFDRFSAREREALRRTLEKRRTARRAAAAQPSHLGLSGDARLLLRSLVSAELTSTKSYLKDAIAQDRKAADDLEHAKTGLAAAPSYDSLTEIITAREAAQAEVARLQAEQDQRTIEVERLEREVAQLRDRQTRLVEAEAWADFEHDDTRRLLIHSTKVRETLERFREAVVERHVARIQQLVLESFHQLIRKRSLVSDLRIDPKTFMLELRGADERPMTPERLSAGERQLLAIAILWGLGKASGRPLPTVIDTPLGRLDSLHRDHLVKRYFPQASHQVLLLSTDEEIAGQYYEALRPSIDRTYHLRFDEAERRTVIEPGYLPAGADAHGH